MAIITSPTYNPGTSLFHKHPPLFRLLELLLLSTTIATCSSLHYIDFWRYGLIGLLILVSIILAKLDPIKILKSELFFFIMASIMFSTRFIMGADLLITLDNTLNFLTIAQVAIFFASILNPNELGDLFYKIGRFIPFVNAGRLRTMVSLTLTTIPLVYKIYAQIEDAAKSRNISRNPIIITVKTVTPLVRELFIHSQKLENAMLSRSYSEESTVRPSAKIRLIDMFILLMTISTAVSIKIL